jgi:hypothetical protein
VVKKILTVGELLFEGMGKSSNNGFIKSIGMDGVTQVFSWTATVKGKGKAAGVEAMIMNTSKGRTPPKGLGTTKDQGVFRAVTGEMAVYKGMEIAKMVSDKGKSVGLWNFMTMAPKWDWMNETIMMVTVEAMDPMWMDFKISIYEMEMK